MKISTNKRITKCKKFLHLSLLCLLALLVSSVQFAIASERHPASSVPDEEVLTAPFDQKVLMQSLFADDDAGVMKGVRSSLESYQQAEDYAKKWHLESTGLYNTPNSVEKKNLITRNIIRYADKRLAGEIKNAEEGTSLHSIGKAEKALRPNTEVGISKTISIKFKARVLQGKALVEVKNPWLECNATLSALGKVRIITKREFKDLGLSSGAEFNLSDGDSIVYADQELSKNLKARVSTVQVNHQKVFSNDADKRLEMMATFPFNL
jgi:hypothetical protein